MRKRRIERNLAFPTEEFRTRVRGAAKERGFRSEQAFILAACEDGLKRGDGIEATNQLEARVAARLHNKGFFHLHRRPEPECRTNPRSDESRRTSRAPRHDSRIL